MRELQVHAAGNANAAPNPDADAVDSSVDSDLEPHADANAYPDPNAHSDTDPDARADNLLRRRDMRRAV